MVAKRAAVEYNNIASYIAHWVKEYDVAKRTIEGIKSSATQNWELNHPRFTRRNNVDTDSDTTYWILKTKAGKVRCTILLTFINRLLLPTQLDLYATKINETIYCLIILSVTIKFDYAIS